MLYNIHYFLILYIIFIYGVFKINKLEFKNKFYLILNTIIFTIISSSYVLLLDKIYLNKTNMYIVNSIENKLTNSNFLPEKNKIELTIYNNIINIHKLKEYQKEEIELYLNKIKEDTNISYVEFNNLLKILNFEIKGN